MICGAGIAGTVVAYRLARAGLRPTVVERSADLRQAGNAVDLRGPALQVMADMGVLAELETRATQLSEFFRIDSSGKRVFTMAPHVIGGEIELLRTELNAVLFNAAQTGVEYRFGDSIRSLHERGDDVAVTFDSGRHGHFDVVIGADGCTHVPVPWLLAPRVISFAISVVTRRISPPVTFSACATQACC
ncbi:FAD binding domain protein [Mycobacteroides abscessus MAB_030201_1075]|uniref:FAD binding domain protein n=1 Tax=Mycobacteroides abscessus MAB_030201_1075 TaxID=1335410 RepID=A0A829PI30_9MYCO|nr:FAD binding domain protein [Mycobacteroides abscessus MAB_030201_1075]